MNTKTLKISVTSAVAASLLAVASVASAEEPKDTSASEASTKLRAPDHAIELSVGTGYAQGLGKVGAGLPSLTDVGTAGAALELGVGYRLDKRLYLGVYGTGATFGRGDTVDSSTNLYSATAGVQAQYHLAPDLQLDPWIGLGTGWRGYWQNSNVGTTSQHGLELARLQVGLDVRVSREVAVSPVIGADLSTFLTQEAAGDSNWHNVGSPNVNTFLFAGVLGRFDIPTGASSHTSQVASAAK